MVLMSRIGEKHADFVKNMGERSLVSILTLLGTITLLFCIQGLMYKAIKPCFTSIKTKKTSFQLVICTVELIMVAFPVLLLMTSLSHLVIECFLVFLVTVLIAALFLGYRKSYRVNANNDKPNRDLHYRVSLAWFKGLGSLVTCIAILAVDFPIFPRESAKTDKFGISLMDIGGAFYIISSAITSKWVRGLPATENNRSFLWHTRAWVVYLGCARLFMVKFLGYQEVEEEYGLHWNFFFTLGAVWIMSDAAHALARSFGNQEHLALSVSAILTISCHQWSLSRKGLSTFIFTASRQEGGFFAQNREGLVSLLAYWPMHVFAELLAKTLVWQKQKQKYTQAGHWGLKVVIVGCLWAGWALSDRFLQETSRRLANLSFLLLSLAIGFTFLLCLMAAEIFFLVDVLALNDGKQKQKQKHEVEGVLGLVGRGVAAQSSLITFLLGNVLTGMVNSLMNTHESDDSTALVVLLGYCAVVYTTSVFASSIKEGGKES